MKMITLTCPKCGADLSIEKGRDSFFCSYCGAKVILHNENEHINRNIDEAAVHRVDNEHKYRMKKLEVQTKAKRGVFWNVAAILCIIAGALIAIIGLIVLEGSGKIFGAGIGGCIAFFALLFGVMASVDDDEKFVDTRDENLIYLSDSVLNYCGQDYKLLVRELERLGFTDIECIPLNDVSLGIFEKPDKVDQLLINGSDDFSDENGFDPDAPVTITYHSRK